MIKERRLRFAVLLIFILGVIGLLAVFRQSSLTKAQVPDDNYYICSDSSKTYQVEGPGGVVYTGEKGDGFWSELVSAGPAARFVPRNPLSRGLGPSVIPGRYKLQRALPLLEKPGCLRVAGAAVMRLLSGYYVGVVIGETTKSIAGIDTSSQEVRKGILMINSECRGGGDLEKISWSTAYFLGFKVILGDVFFDAAYIDEKTYKYWLGVDFEEECNYKLKQEVLGLCDPGGKYNKFRQRVEMLYGKDIRTLMAEAREERGEILRNSKEKRRLLTDKEALQCLNNYTNRVVSSAQSLIMIVKKIIELTSDLERIAKYINGEHGGKRLRFLVSENGLKWEAIELQTRLKIKELKDNQERLAKLKRDFKEKYESRLGYKIFGCPSSECVAARDNISIQEFKVAVIKSDLEELENKKSALEKQLDQNLNPSFFDFRDSLETEGDLGEAMDALLDIEADIYEWKKREAYYRGILNNAAEETRKSCGLILNASRLRSVADLERLIEETGKERKRLKKDFGIEDVF